MCVEVVLNCIVHRGVVVVNAVWPFILNHYYKTELPVLTMHF